MLTLLRWLTGSDWGDDHHVPADVCPWRDHGHNTLLLSHRPPWCPWRRLFELRCVSCDLVVALPPPPSRYDRWPATEGRQGARPIRRWWR